MSAFRKMMSVMLGACLTLLCILTGYTAGAETQNETEKEIVLYVEQYAEKADPEHREYAVADRTAVGSLTGEKAYVVYSFLPEGYIIYDKTSGTVEELMIHRESPYADYPENDLYYAGPMNYLVRSEDGHWISLLDGKAMTEDEIKKLEYLEQGTIENRKDNPKGIPTSTEEYYISSNSYFRTSLGDSFGYNVNGTCTQLACAILLGYYRYCVNIQFVPAVYVCGVGTTDAFHQYLQTFMGTGPSGLLNAAAGMNSYFSDIYFTIPVAGTDIGNYHTVFTRVSNNVSSNRPTVIAMFSSETNDCPYNHSVVAYGYIEELKGIRMTSAAYYVHTGWHGTDSLGVFAWDWFADDLYIS